MQNQTMNPFKALIIVTLIIILSIYAIWMLSKFISSDITIAIISGAVAIVIASTNYRFAKQKETEGRLFTEKQKVYSKLIEMIMGLFLRTYEGNLVQPDDELAKELHNIRTNLIIWGSLDTIKSLNDLSKLEAKIRDSGSPAEGLIWLGNLMENIRRDLGHKDAKNSGKEIAIGIIKTEDQPAIRAEWGNSGN